MQDKREMLVWTLVAVIIVVCIIAGLIYVRNINLKNERDSLQTSLEQWMVDKNKAVADMEQCRTDKDAINTEFLVLKENCNCSLNNSS